MFSLIPDKKNLSFNVNIKEKKKGLRYENLYRPEKNH